MAWSFLSLRTRRADRLEDLAAALDAGLGPDALGLAGLPDRAGGAGLAARICAGLGDPGPVARAVLEAAETAGELPAALRDLARAERDAADRGRDLLARLAYPALVAALAVAVSAGLATLGHAALPAGFWTAWLAALLLPVLAGAAALRRARRDPAFDLGRVPWLGPAAVDAALVPYLDAMVRLHGAGLRIADAHALATAACRLARPRARLTAAGTSLAAGEGFAASLRRAGALDADALDHLAQAERIGGLEASFRTLAERRRATAGIRARRAIRAVGAAAYLWAALLALAVVASFYAGLAARLGR